MSDIFSHTTRYSACGDVKKDVRSPKIGSPMSDNLLTTRYSACAYVKMMIPPQKLDLKCLTIFHQLLDMVNVET